MTFDEELFSIYKPAFGRVIISKWRKPNTCNVSFYDAGTKLIDEDARDGETLEELKQRVLDKARNRRRSTADLLA